MKRGVLIIILILILVISGVLIYYLIRPQNEIMSIIITGCERLNQDYSILTNAIDTSDPEKCAGASNLMLPICIAATSKDASICEGADLESTCIAAATKDPSVCPEQDALCKAMGGEIESCSFLSFDRFACEALVTGDLEYFESERSGQDCLDFALQEQAVETDTESLCQDIKNDILRDECYELIAQEPFVLPANQTPALPPEI